MRVKFDTIEVNNGRISTAQQELRYVTNDIQTLKIQSLCP